jgi:transposase
MATRETSMSSTRYTDEFRAEAVKQVLERGFTVVEVAGRIGLPKHTLYDWVQKARKTAKAETNPVVEKSDSAEIRRLKAELRRVTEERDILKKAAAYFAKG